MGKGKHPVRACLPELFRPAASYEDKFSQESGFGTGESSIFRLRVRRLCKKAIFWLLILALILGAAAAATLAWKVQTVAADDTARYAGADLIDASGVTAGDIMLGIDGDAVESRLRTAYPLIAHVRIKRSLGGQVTVIAEEEQRVYYTQHYMNYYLISGETMEVLYVDSTPEMWSSVDAVYVGLPEEARLRRGEKLTYEYLPYPGENAGQEISTYDVRSDNPAKEFAYIAKVLDAVMESPFGPRVTGIELSDKYDIWFVMDGHIRIVLGNDRDIDVKLQNAAQTLSGKDLSVRASVDASAPDKVTYQEKADLVLPEWAD